MVFHVSLSGHIPQPRKENCHEKPKRNTESCKIIFPGPSCLPYPTTTNLKWYDTSPEIVTFIICALFMGASSIAQMPSMLAGLVTVVPTSCVYLWLKDKRFDSQKLLRKPVQKAKDKKKWALALKLLERSKVNDSFYGICVFDSFYCCLGFLLGLGKLHLGFLSRVAFHWRRRFMVDGVSMTAREFFDKQKSFKRNPKTGTLFYQKDAI
ncbi:hypothetical protein FJZ33_13765 [Candidatus Poribacteria bacterium]|nr:hypothetical protein [Candidatus Poribacteria bacterium]